MRISVEVIVNACCDNGFFSKFSFTLGCGFNWFNRLNFAVNVLELILYSLFFMEACLVISNKVGG